MSKQKWIICRLISVGVGLLLLAGGTMPTSLSAQGPPKLSGALQRLLELRAVSASAAQAYAQTQGIEIRGLEEQLVVVVEGMGDLSAQIRARGGIIQAKYKGLWQVELPLGNLQALAQAAAVSFIRLPQVALIPSPLAPAPSSFGLATDSSALAMDPAQGPIVSEGVILTGADQLHAQGITGSGVKVGIIDLGFAGLDQIIQRGELPETIVAWNCLGREKEQLPLGCRRVSPAELSAVSGAQVHGTAVAEIVHDMAPAAELHLFLVRGEVELGQAVKQAIDEGLRLINHSVAWFNDGSFYDGRGIVGGIVRTARQNGIFWVNAAGNFTQTHYEGTFQDQNSDGFHDEMIELQLEAGQQITVMFTWDDWERAQEDFDLLLMRGTKIEAISNNRPDGRLLDERIYFTAQEAGTYRLKAQWAGEGSPPANRRLELFLMPPGLLVRPYISESSLPEPSNAQEAFAIGAIGVGKWEEGKLEPFSSWGPTNDGRTKPDLVGPDCVHTASYAGAASAHICGADGLFPGTSAAAPHIAGAAALLLSEDSKRTPADLEQLLRERARPAQGTPNQVGAGRLHLTLQALPDLVIAAAKADPREVQAGERMKVRTVVRNTGAGATGPFWVVLWRAEQEGQIGRELVSLRVSQGLGPGEEQEVVLEWAVPAEEAPGEKRLVVVADPFGDVQEQNEENNRQELTVQVRPRLRPAFFAVGPISVSPASPFPEGTTATFEATITNQGEEPDTKTIEFSVNGARKDGKSLTLQPGQSESVSFSYTFTSAGRYTVRISSPDDSKEVTIEVEPLPPAVLEVSPSSLEFQAQEGGSNPPAQPLTISNTGGQPLNWTATIEPKEADWLRPSPISGTLTPGKSAIVQVSVDITGLSVGTHRAVIVITAPGAQNSPAHVDVSLELMPRPLVLRVSPTSLSFSAKAGGSNPSPKELTITNTGSGFLEWRATADVDWLKPGVNGGSLEAGESFELLVFVNIQGLSAGTHHGTITINAPGAEGSPVRVEVTLTLR